MCVKSGFGEGSPKFRSADKLIGNSVVFPTNKVLGCDLDSSSLLRNFREACRPAFILALWLQSATFDESINILQIQICFHLLSCRFGLHLCCCELASN